MSRPIGVVQLIARLNVGGPARLVFLAHEGLREAGFAPVIASGIAEGAEGDMLSAARDRGIDVRVLPALRRSLHPGRDTQAFLQVLQLLRTVRPEILHTHTAKAGTVGRVAARVSRVPVVVHTFHGHVFDGYFSRTGSSLVRLTERSLGRWTDRIVTVSDAVTRDLVHQGVAAATRIERIYPGLDLEEFFAARGAAPELRAEWGVPPGALVVGFLARLVAVKQAHLFIELAERLRASFPDARFVLVGDGDDRASLEAQTAASPARARIVFAGFRHDLPAVCRALDVLVLCSANEGSPLSLIEAQAAGRPVVAFEVGGVGEVVRDGETGTLVPRGDMDGLANGLARLLTDAQRRQQMGEAGRRFMEQRFGASRYVQDTVDLYRRLLAARGGALPG